VRRLESSDVPHSEQRRHALCHVLPIAFTYERIVSFSNKPKALVEEAALTCSAKYTFLVQRGHCGVPPPHCRTGLPVLAERNSPMSAAPYRVPVVLADNGVIRRAPAAPFPLKEFARPRVAEMFKVGDGRFVGDAVLARSGVPASGIVRGSPPSERPTCDGVMGSESSLPWSVALSVLEPSVCSDSALKPPRVGLSIRVGRRRGPEGLAASPNVHVSFRPTVGEENRGPGRPEAEGGGECLEGDDGGLERRWSGEGGGDAAVRDGERDRPSVASSKFAWRRSRVPKFLLWQFLL
jgi:hypothetical protein